MENTATGYDDAESGEARTERADVERDRLLTVKDVSAMLRVSPQTLYKMLDRGSIPAVKVGSQWRFVRDEIRTWLATQGTDSEQGSPE